MSKHDLDDLCLNKCNICSVVICFLVLDTSLSFHLFAFFFYMVKNLGNGSYTFCYIIMYSCCSYLPFEIKSKQNQRKNESQPQHSEQTAKTNLSSLFQRLPVGLPFSKEGVGFLHVKVWLITTLVLFQFCLFGCLIHIPM